MNHHRLLVDFAQATYGCGTYGSGNYQDNCDAASSGSLVNTGSSVVLFGAIAAALIICGVILFLRYRKSRKQK